MKWLTPYRLPFLSFFIFWLFSLFTNLLFAQVEEGVAFEEKLLEANAAFERGDYVKASQLYGGLSREKLPSANRIWVLYRLADSKWRLGLEQDTLNLSLLRRTRQDFSSIKDQLDLLDWSNMQFLAAIEESYADTFWLPRVGVDKSVALASYLQALDALSRSIEQEKAREDYFRILKKSILDGDVSKKDFLLIPPEYWSSAISIATTPQEKALAHWGLAKVYLQSSNSEFLSYVDLNFKEAIEHGKEEPWLANALCEYAAFVARGGGLSPDGRVGIPLEPNTKLAIALYEKVLSLPGVQSNPCYQLAKEALSTLKHNGFKLGPPAFFENGESVNIQIAGELESNVDILVYSVDLGDALRPDDFFNPNERLPEDWYKAISLKGKTPLFKWSIPVDFHSKSEELLIFNFPEKLPLGTYVVEAFSNKKIDRSIVFIGGLDLVFQSTPDSFWGYVLKGKEALPVNNATVVLWALSSAGEEDSGVWIRRQAKTNADGLVTFKLPMGSYIKECFMVAESVNGEAAIAFESYPPYWDMIKPLVVLGFCDRQIYQRGETVFWLANVRNGFLKSNFFAEDYPVYYQIEDASGGVVSSGRLDLNHLKNGSGSFRIKSNAKLGPYFLRLISASGEILSDPAFLFSIEQFRLSHAGLKIKTLGLDGVEKSTFSPEEPVIISLEAFSKIGAPLSGALINLRIHKVKDGFDSEQPLIDARTLQTNEEGKVLYTHIPSCSEDFSGYLLAVKIGGVALEEPFAYKKFFVDVEKINHQLVIPSPVLKPGVPFEILLYTKDKNNNPIESFGELSIEKHDDTYWHNVEDYPISSNLSGEGSLSITLLDEGHYKLIWKAKDPITQAIIAKEEHTIFVLNPGPGSSIQSEQFEVFAPTHFFTPGEKIPVLATVPNKEGTFLISFVSDQLLSLKIMHPEAENFFFEFTVQPSWAPDVYFYLTWVHDHKVQTQKLHFNVLAEEKQLVINPQWDKPFYKPGEKGELTLRVTDLNGKPIEADIALSLNNLKSVSFQPSFFDYFSERTQMVNAPDFVTLGTSLNTFSDNDFLNKKCLSFEDENPGRKIQKAFSNKLIPSPNLSGESKWVHPVKMEPRTLYWSDGIQTNSEGLARLSVTFPEILTDWVLQAWVMDVRKRSAAINQSIQVKAPFDLEFFTSNYFVEGDRVALQAIVYGLDKKTQQTKVTFNTTDCVSLLEGESSSYLSTVNPHEFSRIIEWFAFPQPGRALFEVTADGPDFFERVQLSTPVFSSLPSKRLFQSFVCCESIQEFSIEPPRFFDAENAAVSLSLPLNLHELLAGALFSSYVSIKEKCAEKLGSFLGMRLIVSEILKKNYAENLQLFSSDALESRFLKQILRFQNKDGGWPWFEGGYSDITTTAHLLWLLSLALEETGFDVPKKSLQQARNYLQRELENNVVSLDTQASIFNAFSSFNRGVFDKNPDRYEVELFSKIWKNRNKLTPQGLAQAALGAYASGLDEEAVFLAHRLSSLTQSSPPEDLIAQKTTWYSAENQSVQETAAWCLMALSTILPNEDLLHPALNSLFSIRKGAGWGNNRANSIATVAISRYLKAVPLTIKERSVNIFLNNEWLTSLNVDPKCDTLEFGILTIPGKSIASGPHILRIEQVQGLDVLYPSLDIEYQTPYLGAHSPAEAFSIERFYDRVWSRPTLLSGYTEIKERLQKDQAIACGEELEVVYLVEAKKNLKYFCLEDLLPSGFEIVFPSEEKNLVARAVVPSSFDALKKGERMGLGGTYSLRTRQVLQTSENFSTLSVIDDLPSGFWEIRYRLRATHPGAFLARPAKAYLMYSGEESYATTASSSITVTDPSAESFDLPIATANIHTQSIHSSL